MKIRDADLRQAVHRHGARPGDALWRLLRELQERRDRAEGEGLPEPRAPTVERESGR